MQQSLNATNNKDGGFIKVASRHYLLVLGFRGTGLSYCFSFWWQSNDSQLLRKCGIFFFFLSITQLFVSAFLNLKTSTVPLGERNGDPFWSVTRLRLELFMAQTWIGPSHRTAHSKNETSGKLQIGKQSKSGKLCTGQAKKHYFNYMVPKKHLLAIL